MSDIDILSYLCPECRRTVLLLHMREDMDSLRVELKGMLQSVLDKEDLVLAEGVTQQKIDELTQQILANTQKMAREQKG